ncbi:MAG: carbohydrate ABC transporter permease [Bacillati bacterium ANGP1]|uniref:Carbohydrate ABC transporter permease n=1 Tax=Candidatus Segetimicrobium genomatis TaxID=2569760 RepID=A0A537M0G0_9BACT|nr:MAG: carbohydrate ABC transporter permease [Terrabacteria group bacterium ANGP1]
MLYVLLLIASGGYLLPLYVLVATSMKSFAEVSLARMWALPSGLYFSSFAQAWLGNPAHGLRGLGPNFFNSVKLVVPATMLSAILGSMNGYVLAKWRFRGAGVLFPAILFGMFIPYQSILVPLVQTLQRIGLYGTLPGLIFVHAVYGIPITTLIFRNYYATVPTEIVEAGTMDGAGLWGIYRRIIVPLSPPAFVVAAIWQFTSIWNDFLFGVTVTSQPDVQPITVALNNLAGSFVVEWNVQMGGALLAALPTLVVYVVLGRYFMRGLMAGSLKG